jgi:hypothetical protein
VCLDLCDEIGARPWFCIHHEADDAYIQRLFDEIEPWRPAIIEYSNEIWNSQYRQSGDCAKWGIAAGLHTAEMSAKLFWQADRTCRIKDLSGGKGAVVLASQAANAWVSKTLLGRYKPDALAVAPYFSCDNPTIDRLHAVAIPTALERLDASKAVADAFGVQILLYECGQHVIGSTAIQNTPDMEALYTEYFAGIAARAPEIACHFTNCSAYGKYGDWGTTDNLYVLDTAKRRAVLSFCAPKTPEYWTRQAGIALRLGDMSAAGDALIQAGSAMP